MGLIYASSDASALKSSLAANLAIARNVIAQLTAGSHQLIAAIDGQTLAGAAYTAGKGLFSELILPTIQRVSKAIDSVQEDLNKFSAANSFIASEGYLDEDNLNEQLALFQQSKTALENAAHHTKALAASVSIPGIADTLHNIQRDFLKRAESYQRDITRVKKQLNTLKTFEAKTRNLFQTSLDELALAMQAVLVLNNTTVNSDGTYSLPKGTDKSWFTTLKKSTELEQSPLYAIENMSNDLTAEETERWLIENIQKFGPDFLDYLEKGHKLTDSVLCFKKGRTFLNGTAIYQDALGRLKFGDRFLYKPTVGGGNIYQGGKEFYHASGINLADYHYSKQPTGRINYTELKAAGFSGFKEAVNPVNDFKGWKEVTKFGKLGKGLGIVGTGFTIANNFSENIDLTDGLEVRETVDFVTDTAVDIGTGAGAAAAGAAVGSLLLPPLGTVVGATVGIGVNMIINIPIPFGKPPKSAVEHIKDGIKSFTKNVEDKFIGLSIGFGG